MPITAKIYAFIVAVILSITLVYFYVIKPHYDLKKANDTILQKDKEIVNVKYDGKKETFTTKHETKKSIIKPQRIIHEELNLSIGNHSITFGR